jgi:ATP-dependent protease HslVU (ClpYQ) peptidase subunit
VTTIACDGKTMASDGLVTENDAVCMTDYPKVRRLSDGRIAGFCGNSYNWDDFAAWLENGGDVPKVEDGFGCIVLKPDGEIVSYDKLGRSFPEIAPVANGSGARFALAWMDAGHTAEEAVAYACTRDIYSGGVITAFDVVPSLPDGAVFIHEGKRTTDAREAA